MQTHESPFKAERLDDLFKVALKAMFVACDVSAALPLGSVRTIEDKKRETAASCKPCYAEEEGSQVGIGCLYGFREVTECHSGIRLTA